MNVVVDGLMTNYQKIGRGEKTLVFLHGWADSSVSFNNLINEFRNDYTALVLDLPGFGGSQQPPSAWGTDDYSAFVGAWLKKIDCRPVYAFVAHSFGASVAINGLANGELHSRKLVLLAAAGIRDKAGGKKAAMKAFAKVARLGLLAVPKRHRQKLRAKAYSRIGSDIVAFASMEPTFRRIVSEDMQSQAAKLTMPTLLIYGSDDDQTPPGDGRIFSSRIRNSRLEILEGTGHFLDRDQPEAVAGLIRRFLGGDK